MAEAAVLNDITEGKGQFIEGRSCSKCDSTCKARKDLDQADLDRMLESIQRLKIVARMLWEMKNFDEVELGTVSLMIGKEADEVFEIMENLSDRLGE